MRAFLLHVFILTGFCLILTGCSQSDKAKPGGSGGGSAAVVSDTEDDVIDKTNRNEKMVLALQVRLKEIGTAIASRQSSANASVHFADSVAIKDLAGDYADDSDPTTGNVSPGYQIRKLRVEDAPTTVAGKDTLSSIWASFFESYGYLESDGRIDFGVLSGSLSDDRSEFEMRTMFEGAFKATDGQIVGAKASQTITWNLEGNDQWKIASWDQQSFETKTAASSLFKDVSADAFDSKVIEDFEATAHHKLLVKRAVEGGFPASLGPMFRYFVDWNSAFRYPSSSVVDVDQDGWDDMLVTDRWGGGKLLRNTGDGKFVDITEQSGLDLSDAMANCSLFIDFDNDGDLDALIAQTQKASTFYRNQDGKFSPDEKVNRYISRSRFVVSATAVDINRDGLVDVYMSTYATAGSRDFGWLELAVSPDDLEEMKSRVMKSHSYLDRCGPPNLVLMNRGGNLEEVRIDDTMKQWRCTYQAVWADVDGDGDSDAYLCNDFAPDVLLRNDTPRNSFEPRFTDISGERFSGGEMGFGMGGSFGDYDSDGDLDLYVSNMYSKAGKRVFQQFDDNVNERLRLSAQGNFLFRNDSGKFVQVAGLDDGDQHVSRVGWSFGGQFADFNNDQQLDIYVPSGFFTPPEVVRSVDDL